ncbi:MAG: hypothetical protein ACI93T_002747 [Porticoccaceae bacterium]|jgi:hypothetical protein
MEIEELPVKIMFPIRAEIARLIRVSLLSNTELDESDAAQAEETRHIPA